MEMQDISVEKKENQEDEGAGELTVEVKTQEEAETDHYSELQSPSEDVYTEAFFNESQQKTRPAFQERAKRQQESQKARIRHKTDSRGKDEGNVHVYRAACLVLVLVCLVLLLVIIVLSVKSQTGSTVCLEREEAPVTDRKIPSPTCNLQDCQRQFPDMRSKRLGCRQCADGWLAYGHSCFFLSTFRLTWSKSQLNCTSSGGSLAVITNNDIQHFLTEKGRLKYWIGLRQNESKWNWVNDSELQKSYWKDGETEGDCALLSSEGPPEKNWVRARCQSSTYFICQLQM